MTRVKGQTEFAATARAVLELTRVDKPVGTLLLLWPTLAALWLVADGTPPVAVVVIFVVGTCLMRAAGCVINDIADRHVDGLVTRTRSRPLAAGRLTVKSAVVVLLVLLACALALVSQLNATTQLLALLGVAVAALYPFLKRVTHLPQLALGIAFSWGILMASTALTETVDGPVLLLFLGSFFWIVAYDTQYAMVDRQDDIRAGVKSIAILAGQYDRPLIMGMHLLALLSWGFLGWTGGLGLLYGVCLALIVLLFSSQAFALRGRDPTACFICFKSNVWVGFVLFVGMLEVF